MCCFSRPVESVTATRIFARGFPAGARQYVVYSMRLQAKENLAMILPLPVAPGGQEDAVQFISLKGYPDFFGAMESGFPLPASTSDSKSVMMYPAARSLVVRDVGSFRASYVPSVADFARLDAQFRLPAATWEKLPQYKTYGFAVFQLKPGARTIHPMAFSFPRARARDLFFPTVHIHDGKVHPVAEFDHLLYCQRNPGEKPSLRRWTESPSLAGSFVDPKRSGGIVDPDQHCYRLPLHGSLKNQDTRLALA
jgi:hypothetical protein